MKLTWYIKRTVFITYVKRGGDCKGSSRKRWIVKKNKLLMEQRKIRTKFNGHLATPLLQPSELLRSKYASALFRSNRISVFFPCDILKFSLILSAVDFSDLSAFPFHKHSHSEVLFSRLLLSECPLLPANSSGDPVILLQK